MALQGNLRDFASTEILQLVGTQRKSGCLTLEWNTERASIWVIDGRIVATRQPGMAKDDPLLEFLRRTKRLSDEQYRGIVTIQRESNRDLEDLLLNGRYLDQQELASYVERQVLDDLQRVVRWDNGSYRFDPNTKWPHPPVVSLSMEGALIEASRRVDEQKRFVSMFKDPHQLLGVRDLPDPDESLSEEERELFGIIDGNHTVAEIVQAAPLSEYEAYEALQRMHDSNWIEFVGRRLPGKSPAAPPTPKRKSGQHRGRLLGELVVALVVLAAVLGLRYASARLPAGRPANPANDVFAAAQVRDVRYALDLYHRERGTYPGRLEDLVEDRWIASDQLVLPGYIVVYLADAGGQSYRLELNPDR
jgi:Domain of unknown function (DUF4388)